MVRLAHQAAILNPLIEADMVEALEFQAMAQKKTAAHMDRRF